MRREEGKWKLGLFTGSCALTTLQNCWTSSAPCSSSDQKVKTKSHPFPSRDLVSQLWIPSLEWGHQVLICGSGVFTAGTQALRSMGLAQNVTLSLLWVHLIPGSVFPSLLFYKMGNHISWTQTWMYVTSATCCCLYCNQWATAPLTQSASILNLHFCSNTSGAAAAFSVLGLSTESPGLVNRAVPVPFPSPLAHRVIKDLCHKFGRWEALHVVLQ